MAKITSSTPGYGWLNNIGQNSSSPYPTSGITSGIRVEKGTGKTYWQEEDGKTQSVADKVTSQGGTPGGGVGGYAGPNPAAAAPTLSEATITALIARLLSDYGLEGQEALAAYIRQLITAGVTDETLLMVYLEQRPEWKDRFPGMEARRQQGFSKISARQYVDFENYLSTLFQTTGMPPGFYDHRDDFTRFITTYNDLNLGRQDINTRLQSAFTVVATAPQEVRDKFGEYFGVHGDSALASYVLDPDRATPILQKQAEVATIGGIGGQFGFNVNKDLSFQLHDRGVNAGTARQGFGQISDINPLFQETVSERADFTAEREGIESVFRLDTASTDRLERRLEQRRANFAGNARFIQGQTGGLAGLRVGR